jgi:hypothetical protein
MLSLPLPWRPWKFYVESVKVQIKTDWILKSLIERKLPWRMIWLPRSFSKMSFEIWEEQSNLNLYLNSTKYSVKANKTFGK